jgi:hypothetical protein
MVIEPFVVGVRGLQLRRGRCRPRLRCGGVLGEISLVSHSIVLSSAVVRPTIGGDVLMVGRLHYYDILSRSTNICQLLVLPRSF